MNDYQFIKQFQNIKLSRICKEKNILLPNILNGTTTEENYTRVKNEIVRELLILLIAYKGEDLLLITLYNEIIDKLEKENKSLKEML